MPIEKTLMKLNIHHFNKRLWIIRKIQWRKDFDSEQVNNKQYLAAETKSFNETINTIYHDNEIPKEGF